MLITTQALKAAERGFKVVFDGALQGGEPQWPAVAMATTSTNAEECYGWLGAVPSMKKLLGEVVIENLKTSDFIISNDEYESTVAVKEADMERDRMGIYTPVFAELGRAAGLLPDEKVADLLLGGFSTKDYTGKAFFAVDKPHNPNEPKGAKFTNLGTKALSMASFAEAKANVKSRTNSAGRSMKLGRDLVLVVSPALEAEGLKILKAETIDATTNVHRDTARLVVLADLGESRAWYVMEAGLSIKPIIVQTEKAPALAALTTMESDHVFKYHEYLYQAYARFGFGYGLPQLIFGSTGADV